MPEIDMHRILVIANRSCPCPALAEEVHRKAGALDAEIDVLIVAPALNTRLKHWASDSDEAVSAARERLTHAVQNVAEGDVRAHGELGDADPLIAIADALDRFAADEIVISTFPAEQSNWLEKDLLSRTEERFALPISHVISRYGEVALS